MLLGNKADMTSERLIKTEDGEKLAKVSMLHYENTPMLYTEIFKFVKN